MAWKCAECGSENSEDSMRCTCSHVRQIDYKQKETSRTRVFSWVGTILSVGGVFYCFLGFAMVTSFSVTTPKEKITLGIYGVGVFGRYGNMLFAGNPLRCFNHQKTTEEGALSREQFFQNIRFFYGNSNE